MSALVDGQAGGAGGRDPSPSMKLLARAIYVPLENQHFRAAMKAGVVERGLVAGKVRTEITAFTLGESSWATLPGYLAGAASFHEALPGRIRFLMGLGNDHLGPIFPEARHRADCVNGGGSAERIEGMEMWAGAGIAHVLHDALIDIWRRIEESQPSVEKE